MRASYFWLRIIGFTLILSCVIGSCLYISDKIHVQATPAEIVTQINKTPTVEDTLLSTDSNQTPTCPATIDNSPTPLAFTQEQNRKIHFLSKIDDEVVIIESGEINKINVLIPWDDERFSFADGWEFSPDGTQVIVTNVEAGVQKPRLFILDVETNEARQLIKHSSMQLSPKWSPDGQTILFTIRSENESGIYTVKEDGSDLNKLPSVTSWDWSPTWSPDGKYIYFLSSSGYEPFEVPFSDIYVMNSDGSNVNKVTSSSFRISSYSISPNGLKITFSGPSHEEEIFVMSSDGKDLRNITNSPSRDTSPLWSPDGSRIAFQSDRDGNWEIYIMDIYGADIIRLTQHNELDVPIMWSPNGEFLAIESERSGIRQIYTLQIEDYSIRKITQATKYAFLNDIWIDITQD